MFEDNDYGPEFAQEYEKPEDIYLEQQEQEEEDNDINDIKCARCGDPATDTQDGTNFCERCFNSYVNWWKGNE